MIQLLVKDVMVPLADYATVSEDAGMFDAVLALEKAQKEFDQTRDRHRAILVYNDKGKIVGKISQLDLIKALEPKYEQIDADNRLSRFGYSMDYFKSLFKQHNLWSKPLNDICRKAATIKVKTFMYVPTEGEYVNVDTGLNEAVHQLIMGCHHSLLVTDKGDIVGILRLTDVFKRVTDTMKACNL
jgi:CBS-domain-containing membrane protein